MSNLLVVIGLDDPLVDRIRAKLADQARIVSCPTLPNLYALDGEIYVESQRVVGRWLRPRGVLYYSYFENAQDVRRALALGSVPTFPDVRTTLPLDDKVLALLAANRAVGPLIDRGYVPAGVEIDGSGKHVLKSGDMHCGEGKRLVEGPFRPSESSLVEPFLDGESHRILFVGDDAWQLRYDSSDWRKNVNATITRVEMNRRLHFAARQIADNLDLSVAGVDFLLCPDKHVLLEVNAYPALDDVPEAEEAFIELVSDWWEKAEHE